MSGIINRIFGEALLTLAVLATFGRAAGGREPAE